MNANYVSRTINPTRPNNIVGIYRILSAAVVNQKFRNLLLNDPEIALASGYNGARFHLEAEEKEKILSIHASSLSEFAQQLAGNSKSNKHRRRGYTKLTS